jgi:hypothetical protein
VVRDEFGASLPVSEERWTDAELRDRCRTVRLVRDVPEVLDELLEGRLSIAQTRETARVRANPCCGDQVVETAATPSMLERTRAIMPPDHAGGRETEGHHGSTRTEPAVTTGRLNRDDSGELMSRVGRTRGE